MGSLGSRVEVTYPAGLLSRSLGTPKGSALGQALLPMGLLGFVGVMAGFVAAYYYGLEKAREAVASLQTAQSLAVRVPLTKLIGLF